jgi:hypothetical protein
MQLFSTFLIYILIGIGACYLGRLFRKYFPAAFGVYLIATPISTFILYGFTLLGRGYEHLPSWVGIVSMTMRWIDRATLVLLGYGLASLTYGAGYRQFIYLIRGLSIQLGLSFVGSAVEQYRDIASVRQFFLTSGYAVWMMHLTLGIELVLGYGCSCPHMPIKKCLRWRSCWQ